MRPATNVACVLAMGVAEEDLKPILALLYENVKRNFIEILLIGPISSWCGDSHKS